MTKEARLRLAMSNLERANQKRLWRAAQRRVVEAGDYRLGLDLLTGDDPRMATCKIGGLLMWLPGVGKVRAESFMIEAMPWAPTSKTMLRPLGRFSPKFRHELAFIVEEWCEAREGRRLARAA